MAADGTGSANDILQGSETTSQGNGKTDIETNPGTKEFARVLGREGDRETIQN